MFKRLVFIGFIIFVLTSSCDVLDSTMKFYRHIVTLETDLDNLRYDNTYLDSSTVYPYTLMNYYETRELSNYITIYPITSNGNIHFNMFRGEGYDNIPITNFIDSLPY